MSGERNDPTRAASTPEGFGDDTVILSLPEIASIGARAARGAGLDWGLAEEAGHAAQWLARRGADWARVLLSRLEGDAGADIVPATGAWHDAGPVCGLRAGVTLAEFASLPEGPGGAGVALGRVLDPLLLLPFVERAAALIGHALRVEAGDGPGPWVWQTGAGLVGDGCPAAAAVRVVPGAAPGRPAVPVPGIAGVPVPVALWSRLDGLALGMTVPATRQSLAGAGGAGSDND